MKKILVLVFLIFVCTSNLLSQSSFSSYYSQNRFGLTSPGAMKYGLYGYDNPALLAAINSPDVLFTWSDQNKRFSDLNHWGLFVGLPNIGFGMVHQTEFGYGITDYKLSSAFGNESFSIGTAFGWSSGDLSFFNRADIYTAGVLIRPNNFVSIGLIGNFPVSFRSEFAADLAIRPFGNEWLSIFGDYAYRKFRFTGESKWSAGLAIEPLSGLRLVGRFFDNKFFNAGVQVSFGKIGLSFSSNLNQDGKNVANIYGLRVGEYDRNIISTLFPKEKYINLNLLGGIKYQRYKWFDDSNTLYDLLSSIKAAKDDESVRGIAINLSGLRTNRTYIWEIR
ncbi:MAG: hypothetical protein HXY50_15850 [Ignavibacteriaceae bacterium]|nr:hypothetical protein [Ignavibacteriaceae bacterium]